MDFLQDNTLFKAMEDVTAGNISETLPMTCHEYITNITAYINTNFNTKEANGSHVLSAAGQHHQDFTTVITKIVVPVVCAVGILGNVLNLIVLTRKQLQCTMDHMEKSAHLGLVALAVSDLLFCLLYFLVTLTMNDKVVYTYHDPIILLYYNIYHEPLTNIFLLSSTWLTVIMALGRYIGICRPLHARGFINLRGTRIAIIGVYLASIVANLPKFWHYYTVVNPCTSLYEFTAVPEPTNKTCHCYYYTKAPGDLYFNELFVLIYAVAYFLVGLIVPLILLTFCNICLIRALRRSYQMQRQYRATTPRDSGHRITPTLITIIIIFTLLVTPSELLAFFKVYVATHRPDYMAFKTANTITNFFLVTNFAINFILYCVINVQFRKTVRYIICCKWRQKRNASPDYIKTNQTTLIVNYSEFETEM